MLSADRRDVAAAREEDEVCEGNSFGIYFITGVLFISKVGSLGVKTTGHPQSDTTSGIFVLDY